MPFSFVFQRVYVYVGLLMCRYDVIKYVRRDTAIIVFRLGFVCVSRHLCFKAVCILRRAL